MQRTAGSMALSGMDLTEDDKARILQLLEHPDEMDAILEELIQKHTVSADEMVDPSTGIKLTPSYQGKECLGNGSWPGYECCCDECDYFLTCFPDYNDPNHEHTYGDRRDFWRPNVREETCFDCLYRGKRVAGGKPWKPKLFCNKTKKVGRELRGHRCPHFERDED